MHLPCDIHFTPTKDRTGVQTNSVFTEEINGNGGKTTTDDHFSRSPKFNVR